MARFLLVLAFSAVVFVATAEAQSPSGPEPGTRVPALKVAVATGENAGKELDLAKERAEKPTVYVFVQADKWDRRIARYLKQIDQELTKGVKGAEQASLVITWLTTDVEKSKKYLPIAQQSLNFENSTLAVFAGPRTGPADWSINDAAYLSTIVVRGGKVVDRFGFISVGDVDVAETVKALSKPASGK